MYTSSGVFPQHKTTLRFLVFFGSWSVTCILIFPHSVMFLTKAAEGTIIWYIGQLTEASLCPHSVLPYLYFFVYSFLPGFWQTTCYPSVFILGSVLRRAARLFCQVSVSGFSPEVIDGLQSLVVVRRYWYRYQGDRFSVLVPSVPVSFDSVVPITAPTLVLGTNIRYWYLASIELQERWGRYRFQFENVHR